jgi:hypothetical protein
LCRFRAAEDVSGRGRWASGGRSVRRAWAPTREGGLDAPNGLRKVRFLTDLALCNVDRITLSHPSDALPHCPTARAAAPGDAAHRSRPNTDLLT